MIDEEEDKFLKENPIVFKKFKVKRKLGEGAFGDVYLGQAIENNAYVALKVEPRKIAKPILESEAFLLYSIAGPGIPEVKSFGKVKNYTVLVEPLLGKSLFDIFAENHKEMPMEDICLIGKQVIDRIQWVHSKFIVHRDIKPDNFLIGKKDPNVIYIIDFGLSKKYRSSTTNKHIRFGFTGKLTGTVRFASANALRGGEQSRRDDIESIGYMLVYFMKKRLPWQGVTGTRKMERYLKIYKMKKNTTPEDLCNGLPPEMTEYIRYAKKLEFEQQPDYKYLRGLFSQMLKKIHNTNDQLIFSWIKLTDLPNLKNPVNPSSRRESPQSRIYKKIKSSLERERNISSDSCDSKHGSYQQVYTQANIPTSNLKLVDKNNNTESEFEQKTEKNLNKKLLKAKEGLNTMIANLDVTVDENVVDFDNETIKRGSKDFGEFTINSNNTESSKPNIGMFKSNNLDFNKNVGIKRDNRDVQINNKNDNKNINMDSNNQMNFDSNNQINNNYPINDNNPEINKMNGKNNDMKNNILLNNNLDNDINNINDNLINGNPINTNPINTNPININPINTNPINTNPINTNPINTNTINANPINTNPINTNTINANPINTNPININLNNPDNNASNSINSINNIKNIKDSNDGKASLFKSKNVDDKEFTFSEPMDFKSKIIFDKKMKDKDLLEENKEENKENQKLKEEEKNNVYALLTGNNQYMNNNFKENYNIGDMKNKNNNFNYISNLNNIQNKNKNISSLDNNGRNNNLQMNQNPYQKNINRNMNKNQNNFYNNNIYNNNFLNDEKLNNKQKNIFNNNNNFINNNNGINNKFNNQNNQMKIMIKKMKVNNNNNNYRNNNKIDSNNFPKDNESDDMDNNININNNMNNKAENPLNNNYNINKRQNLNKGSNNNKLSNNYNIQNNNLNENNLMVKKIQKIGQFKNTKNMHLMPEDALLENRINKNKMNTMNENNRVNYNNNNINKIDPSEYSLKSNEINLNKMNNNYQNNNVNKKNQPNINMNMNMINNININKINMGKGKINSPRNQMKNVRKINPNQRNILINQQQYQNYQQNLSNNYLNKMPNNNSNKNINNINMNNNQIKRQQQNIQFQMYKKMMPSNASNKISPKGNYQKIQKRMNMMNNANMRNPKYGNIIPSQIQNQIGNATVNFGNQYSNITANNNNNTFDNLNFRINNQVNTFPNEQIY